MSLDEFYLKRQNRALESAKSIYAEYYKKNKEVPPRTLFKEYLSLYIENEKDLTKEERNLIKRTGHEDSIISSFGKKSKFLNYDEFIKYLDDDYKKNRI